MGGVWGLASSTALENLPVEARGLGSGVLQQGYAIGYLISAILNLYVVPHSRHTWRALFWTTACISAFAAIIRAIIPESEVFLHAKERERALGGSTGGKTKVFIHQVRMMLKAHWGRCVYAILLMAGELVWHTPEDMERTEMWDRFQLLFSWFPGFVPYLPPDDQRFRQIPFDRRNDYRQCRRHHVCLSH
jgi:SHS family lactate transporter-like MFS transporter